MSVRIPLGQRETLHREFKGGDALRDPEMIAREVVAMLNADGGTIWIGLCEEEGRAVAVEPIADPEGEKGRLLNYLIDTIEPAISSSVVSIEVQDEGQGAALAIAVGSTAAKPYAYLKKAGRHFVIRVGDRIRPMTRSEIFHAASPAVSESLQTSMSKVMEEREEVLGKGEESFWMRLEPAVEVALDIQDPRLEEFLQNPQATGNRASGWNFSKFQYRPRIRKDSLTTSPEELLKVEIRRDGGLVFSAPLETLYWKGKEDNQIWPPVLIEYIVSALRLARAIYHGLLHLGDAVVVDLLLTGLNGWILRPGTPDVWFSGNYPMVFAEDDFVPARPLVFRFEEIDAEPDRCGYRLVERIYEGFGIRKEGIPKLFDAQSGRLVFPE